MHFIYKWRKKCRFLTCVRHLCDVFIEQARTRTMRKKREREHIVFVRFYFLELLRVGLN
jgi:hypothetical protein